MEKVLELSHLKKYYGQTHAVEDVSFHVNAGEVVVIIGPSGAGKSTVLRFINRMIEPTDGNIPVSYTHLILLLCMIGIPIGASAAFLFSVIAIPAAIGAWKFVSTGAVLSFSPIIYFGAAAFALCTSLLGAFLPAKKAAEVSPVEAQKFTGISRPHLHRPAHGKPYKMALRNIFRNRKRAAVVLLSLFLGITAFTAVTTLAYSMGVDQYIDSLYQKMCIRDRK